jgi:hypothetical protein
MAVEVIICYAHKDERFLHKLKIQLKPLLREGLVNLWHDRDISAGKEWKHEIDEHLNTAQIILLLVSPDFIDSDYCYSIEMERAIERHEQGEPRAIPIILRPTDWYNTSLRKLQALPKNGKPITLWANRDQALLDAARGIRKAVGEMNKQILDNTLPIPKPPNLVNQQYQSNQEERIQITYTKGVDEEALVKLRDEMQRQREADNFLLEANKFASSIMEKNELVQKAVERWPPYKQKELRQLGIEMSVAVIDGYDPTTQMGIRMAGLGRGMVGSRRLKHDDLVWLAVSAISYLRENVLEATTPDVEGLLYLACMYGFQLQYDDMMIIIDKAVQIDGEIKERFQQRKILLTLLRAGGTDQMKLESLRKRLGILPDTKSNFRTFIQDFDLTDFHGYIKWIGMKRPNAAGERGIFVLHITPPYEQNEGLVSASTLSVESWQTENIANGDLVSISKLYDVVHASFALICPSE